MTRRRSSRGTGKEPSAVATGSKQLTGVAATRLRAGGPRGHGEGVRAAALWVLERTLQSMAPVDGYLESAQAPFDDRDRGFLRELVLGTLRWLRRLDHVITQASDRNFEDIEPGLRTPLRIGVYQLLFHDRVPAHAAVNESVELALRATHRGGASFANAVLRRVGRTPTLSAWPVRESDPLAQLGIEWSHPDFLVERWIAQLGRAATIDLLAANNRQKPMHLLAFRDRGGREVLAEALIDQGVEVEPSHLAPFGLSVRQGSPTLTAAFEHGDFYIQDEASQAAALVPPPRPGEWVLDAAAAPGGKTFAGLAHEPSARYVASDASLERLLILRQNARRLGRQLPLLVADAARLPFSAEQRTAFDRVLLDLPCSGTGTLRKHPELKWRLSPSEIERLGAEGLALALAAAPCVRPGGTLILMTCSIEPQENEDVVAKFLAERADFALADLADTLPRGLEQAIVAPGFWRLLPGAGHDGFSVHVLVRRAERREVT